jgi:CDP-glucose 4,6-dehydratase
MVTTDKVYRNNEWPWPYREDDALGGHDPYSASKAACEIAIGSYRSSYFVAQGVAVATARAGNVIGGGDWSEGRLLPDAARAWQAGRILDIRRPQAIRPWQHVLDPLAGYLRLAERLVDAPELASAYNFGPATHEAATVREVITRARVAYGCGEVSFGDGSEGPHEAEWLALETAKARSVLGMTQRWDLDHSVRQTMNWYREQQQGADAYRLCLADIEAFGADS